jgi:hypothetical protein
VLSVPPNCSQSVSYHLTLFLPRDIFSTLKMEATRSSETSAYDKPTRYLTPEDGIMKTSNPTYYFLFTVSSNSALPVLLIAFLNKPYSSKYTNLTESFLQWRKFSLPL